MNIFFSVQFFSYHCVIIFQNDIQAKAKDDTSFEKFNYTKQELINIIAVHEGVHATNPTYNSHTNNTGEDIEYLPRKMEAKTRHEIIQKYHKFKFD